MFTKHVEAHQLLSFYSIKNEKIVIYTTTFYRKVDTFIFVCSNNYLFLL
jgi:hypothetical protein